MNIFIKSENRILNKTALLDHTEGIMPEGHINILA
jgi:hypothetical protein